MKTFPINDNVNKNKGQDCSSMPMTPRTQSSKKKNIIHSTAIILVWYHCFGLVHEIAHLLSAWVLGLWTPPQSFVSFLGVILKAFLGRACEIPTDDAAREQQLWSFYVVRHAGWVASLLLALLLSCTIKQGKVKRKSLTVVQITAWVTFIEAFSTDFLGIGVVLATGANATTNIFFCGNFGLILINSGWMDEDYGRKALDMLEQMVHITMMRGAQSGGVLAWAVDKNKGDNGTIQSAKGIRSRVVNGKRTDLSKGVRRKVLADSFSNGKICRGIQTFLGHTRFATSSMATFDGTHPHQWTPPQKRRVYAMKSSSVMNSSSPKPQVGVLVENFITHNGDFDFYTVNDVQYGLSTIQEWLVLATGKPLLSAVDSIAVAGLVDLLRTEGCFGLSARYALLLNCETSKMETGIKLPSYSEFEHLGRLFEDALLKVCKQYSTTMVEIKASSTLRQHFSAAVHHAMNGDYFTVTMAKSTLATLISIDEEYSDGVSLHELASRTIDAFFDNDLFQATRILMSNAKGSFGLMVTSSLDANRQICLAARGQPISLAFYPKEGLVFYGSELASVKVGLDVKMPPFTNGSPLTQIKIADVNSSDDEVIVEQTSRLDLDDLGGEVVLLDWGCGPIGKDVHVLVHQESRTTQSRIASRIVLLENNEFVRPLTRESRDPVLNDIRDIPRACQYIQDNWKEAGLNRYTAYNLVSKINERLMSRMKGDVPTHCNSIDILLTGCETSLWLAEQFASDLTKSFGRLNVKAVSSNKLLGIFGQDMSMPAVGFPMSENVPDLKGAVVIIVSHSGQTFAPLACSSLLQSFTDNIFLVSSEWDTQIGRQLRGIGKRKHPLRPGMNDLNFIYSSRIFTTDVGVRPAEPCSVSVAAIQQLLTQLYMHVSISLLAGPELRTFCGAIVTESDLRILERCNQESINALECIVGSDRFGVRSIIGTNTEQELRRAGNVWSEHVLENPKAYILTFLYVVGTVVSGYPFITGVAIAAGLENGWWFYLLRFCDGLLYFFFNQLTIFALRLLQGRSLRHRTTGRTVVIGDCPWVAQSIDSFLSKLFACSYPMAGINVLNGNPADHLVHRHTHRVVRGSLLICGRPDGRLSALTNAEVSVCLSVNQASSIQSIGGTCESITIGHNPSPLAATSKDIFLSNHRPLFLCERVADDLDEVIDDMGESGQKTMLKVPSFVNRGKAMMIDITTGDSHHNRNQSRHSQHVMGRSRHSIQIMDRSKHSLNIMDLSKHSHQIMDLSKHSHHIFDLSKHTCNSMDLSKRKLGTTKLDLSKHANSLTEHVMDDGIWREEDSIGNSDMEEPSNSHEAGFSKFKRKISMRLSKRDNDEGMDVSNSTRKASRRSRRELFRDDSTIVRNGQSRSALEIKGLYATFQILAQAETEKTDCQTAQTFANSLEQRVVDEMLKERQGLHLMRRIFDELDAGKTGFVSVDIFIGSYLAANGELSETQIRQVFKELGIGGDNGLMDFEAFVRLSQMPEVEVIRKLQISAPRNEKGLLLVHPSEEEYFGQELQHSAAASGFEAFALAKTQHFAMELYESRIASLERFVSMCVMFHQMGSRVQCFFEKVSFGFLSYRMDRTHSIMRIATTASPVSGADVRERIEALQVRARVQNALRVIESAWYKYQQRQIRDWKEERSRLSAAHKSCVESAKLLSSETVLPTPDPPLDETTELNALKSSFSRSLGQKDWSTASLGDNRSGSVRFENTGNNPTTVSTMRKSLPPRSLGTPDTSVGSRGVDNNHSSGTVRFENSATDLSVGSDEVKSPPAPRSFGESYSSMRSLGGNRSGSIRFGNREISPTVIDSFVQAGTGHQAAAGRQRADATATVWGNSQTSAESRRSGTPLSLASLILHFEAASQQLN